MNKLSFIIPVFNCVDYLLECVESIEKIGLADYEILLIEDQSMPRVTMCGLQMLMIKQNQRK